MSVIIRLQNLPWSANALDIRNFFQGLSIPDGGVHIVGGEMGDAFIAFSTDEDARQAMMLTGSKLKETQVQLLLSSRAEMQKVIETARQTSIAFMQYSAPIAAVTTPAVEIPKPVTSPIVLPTNNVHPPLLTTATLQNVAVRQNYPAQTMPFTTVNVQANDRLRLTTTRRTSRDRHYDRHSSSDSRSSSRSRSTDRSRRSRSTSRDRSRRRRDRSRSHSRSHSRDHDGRTSRRNDRYRSRSRERSYEHKDKRPALNDRKERFSRFSKGIVPQQQDPKSKQSVWEVLPNGMNVAAHLASKIPKMNPMVQAQMLPGMHNDIPSMLPNNNILGDNRGSMEPIYVTNNDHVSGINNNMTTESHSIKVSNLDSVTGYSEIRRFFTGLHIANSGIKMINDERGQRLGVAYVTFVKTIARAAAISYSNKTIRGKVIRIEGVSDQEFHAAVDNFKPGRFDPSNERSEPNRRRDHDNEENSNDDVMIIENEEDMDAKEDVKPFDTLYIRNVPSFSKEQDIIKMFSNYTLMHIVLTKVREAKKMHLAYVKFFRPEDAMAALNDTSSHVIAHRKVFVSQCSDREYREALDEYNSQNEMELKNESSSKRINLPEIISNIKNRNNANTTNDPRLAKNNNVNGENEDNQTQEGHDSGDDHPNKASSSGSASDSERAPKKERVSRFSRPSDPRLARQRHDERSDCIKMTNLEFNTNEQDIHGFFESINLKPKSIYFIPTPTGQFSGECFCEFHSFDDAQKALTKHNQKMGPRAVRIALISRKLIQEIFTVLNQQHMQHQQQQMMAFNNGGMNCGGNMQQQMMMHQNGMGMNGNEFNNMNYNQTSNGRPNLPNGPMMDNMNRGNFPGQPNMQHPQRPNGGHAGVPNNNMGVGNHNNMINGGNRGMMSGNGAMPQARMPMNAVSGPSGPPGCVLAMRNVPYKAGMNEIIDFLSEFKIQQNQIVRRYNDDGTPTGDARVCFANPIDAMRAFENKKFQKIMNRSIHLSIL